MGISPVVKTGETAKYRLIFRSYKKRWFRGSSEKKRWLDARHQPNS
jgi:hypothetical protein